MLFDKTQILSSVELRLNAWFILEMFSNKLISNFFCLFIILDKLKTPSPPEPHSWKAGSRGKAHHYRNITQGLLFVQSYIFIRIFFSFAFWHMVTHWSHMQLLKGYFCAHVFFMCMLCVSVYFLVGPGYQDYKAH